MADLAINEDWAEARALLAECLVWDNHACMPIRPEDESFLPQIERMRAAGVDVVSLNIGFGEIDLLTHVRMIAHFRQWFGARPDDYVLVNRADDIDAARASGKLAITFDIEGMAPFDQGDFGLVEMFADLGVRWMLVAYNRGNSAGSGCTDEADGGLTAHGRAMLAEMKRVGMVACCSHTGHRTARDVMEYAGNPVIFSHSNASAIHAHYRNIPDDLIRACAATGGVIGVNGIGAFIGAGDQQPEDLLAHLDHMVQLVGPDHVGISLDYVFDLQEIAAFVEQMRESVPEDPNWADDFRQLPVDAIVPLVAGMMRRGYRRADIAKIVGGNWRRIAGQVWR